MVCKKLLLCNCLPQDLHALHVVVYCHLTGLNNLLTGDVHVLVGIHCKPSNIIDFDVTIIHLSWAHSIVGLYYLFTFLPQNNSSGQLIFFSPVFISTSDYLAGLVLRKCISLLVLHTVNLFRKFERFSTNRNKDGDSHLWGPSKQSQLRGAKFKVSADGRHLSTGQICFIFYISIIFV